MPYNFANLTNATDFLDIARYVMNEASGGWFGVFFVIATFAVFFISMKGYETKTSFAAASLITTVVALFLFTLNLAPAIIFYATLILSGMAVVFLLMRQDA